MGAWRERPSEWPFGMPPPEDAGWQGWALHWLSAHAAPHWLTRAALEQDVRPRDLARLAWRLRSAEAAALKLSAPWVHQAMLDTDVPVEVVAEIDSLIQADMGRRRQVLDELRVVGKHM